MPKITIEPHDSGMIFATSEDDAGIFVAVQTPHEPQYGGAVRLPADRKDFDYMHLKQAITELEKALYPIEEHREPVIAVISTVLPGTMRREILPLMLKGREFVYCPFFAAMGTVVEDVLDPEFVILGVDDVSGGAAVQTALFFGS